MLNQSEKTITIQIWFNSVKFTNQFINVCIWTWFQHIELFFSSSSSCFRLMRFKPRAFRLVLNNTCYWLKQITLFILANSRFCLLQIYLQFERFYWNKNLLSFPFISTYRLVYVFTVQWPGFILPVLALYRDDV